jgi:hypothetical protein
MNIHGEQQQEQEQQEQEEQQEQQQEEQEEGKWKRIEPVKHVLTVRAHTDYVKCIATNGSQHCTRFATGGLDNVVHIWDTNRFCSTASGTSDSKKDMTPLSSLNSSALVASITHKNSIYTLSMNQSSNLLATGSSDKFVRIFDLRTVSGSSVNTSSNKLSSIKLRGHQDNVRHVIMNALGTRVVSASCDGTIKCWDLRHERCLQTFYIHEDSVWTLCWLPQHYNSVVVGDQQALLSGGKDGQIHYININTFETCHLINTVGKKAVLSLCPTAENNLWVSTCDVHGLHEPRQLFSLDDINTCNMFEYDYMDRLKKLGKRREMKKTGMSSSFNYGSPLIMRRMSFTNPTSVTTTTTTTTTTTIGASNNSSSDNHSTNSLASSNRNKNGNSNNNTNSSSSSNNNNNRSDHDTYHTSPSAQIYPPPHKSNLSSTSIGGNNCRTDSISPDDKPLRCIPSSPAIIQYHILNNRRHVLARDNFNRVTLWDISTGKQVLLNNKKEKGKKATSNYKTLSDYGVDTLAELEQKEFFEMLAIPNWFSIQTKLGSIEVVLDLSNCFTAEVYAIDAGFPDAQPDEKVNMGFLIVDALFRDWFRKEIQQLENEKKMEEDQNHSENSSSEEKTTHSESGSTDSEEETLGDSTAKTTSSAATAVAVVDTADPATNTNTNTEYNNNNNNNNNHRTENDGTTKKETITENNESYVDTKEKDKKGIDGVTGEATATNQLETSTATTTSTNSTTTTTAAANNSLNHSTHTSSNVLPSSKTEVKDSETINNPKISNKEIDEKEKEANLENNNSLSFIVYTPIMYTLPDDTPVIIHHDKISNSMIPFRKQIKEFDGSQRDSICIPKWIKDALRTNGPPEGTVNVASQKIAFYLESIDDKLPNLQYGHSRLSASRLLRIYKVTEYIVSKLNFKLPSRKQFEMMKEGYEKMTRIQPVSVPLDHTKKTYNNGNNTNSNSISHSNSISNFFKSAIRSASNLHHNNSSNGNNTNGNNMKSTGSAATSAANVNTSNNTKTNMEEETNPVKAQEFLEIFCNGKSLDNNYTLAIANKFFRDPNSSAITLQYRRRYPVPLTSEESVTNNK